MGGPPNPPGQGAQAVQQFKVSDILLACTTVASLAVAVVVFALTSNYPTNSRTPLATLVIFSWGSLELSLGRALLICGLLSIVGSIWAVETMRREGHLPKRALIQPRSNLSWLFVALCVFLIIYIGMLTKLV